MGVIATAVVGLMSAVAGGVVKGYWEREVAIEKHRSESAMVKQKFESDLILKALQSGSTDERTKSLKFLVDTNLITDPEVQKGVRQLIEDPNSIPQFILDGGAIASARDQFLAENQELVGKTLVLIGFDVRVGQLIDALAPIFAVLKPDLTLGEHKRGAQVGGDGGGAHTLLQEGYVVTGIDSYRGNYFGAEHLIHLQIYWHRLTPTGIDYEDGRVSEKLATGDFAKDVILEEEFRVEPGYFVSDYQINEVPHTDGTNYVGTFKAEQQKLPAYHGR